MPVSRQTPSRRMASACASVSFSTGMGIPCGEESGRVFALPPVLWTLGLAADAGRQARVDRLDAVQDVQTPVRHVVRAVVVRDHADAQPLVGLAGAIDRSGR